MSYKSHERILKGFEYGIIKYKLVFKKFSAINLRKLDFVDTIANSTFPQKPIFPALASGTL
jgi:hypothetical protein